MLLAIAVISAAVFVVWEWSMARPTGSKDAAFLAESDATMTNMMAAMQIQPSTNVDGDFVALMVPHHQGAIDLAEAELRYGYNLPLLGLAQEIIATQEQQIAVMRGALGEPLPLSQPPTSISSHLLSEWTLQHSPCARGGFSCNAGSSLSGSPAWPWY